MSTPTHQQHNGTSSEGANSNNSNNGHSHNSQNHNNSSNINSHHHPITSANHHSPNQIINHQHFSQSIHTVQPSKSLLGSPAQFNPSHQHLQHHNNNIQGQHIGHNHLSPPIGLNHSTCNSHNTYGSHNFNGYVSSGNSLAINNAGCAITLSSNNNAPSRLSQPIRTQIPIHCYIEQLEDLPGYCSTINDSELFSTTNPTRSGHQGTRTSANLSQHGSTQPYLHQSKLALESVTNGTTLSLTAPSSSSSVNANDFFSENDTANNDNNDLDQLDNLNPNSPLSIQQLSNEQQSGQQQQQTSTNSSITHSSKGTSNSQASSNPNANRTIPATSSTLDNPHLQSCRETYAIVTSNVLYQDLVRTVLLQLGYSDIDLINAKGKFMLQFILVRTNICSV